MYFENRIFLVHGTFAEDAAWVQKDSKIASRLRAALNAETVSFSWSGGNSHSERKAASQELAKAIKIDAQEHPDSLRSIVAHSHGGNVAIRALRELEVETNINWLICLGTPFLILENSFSDRLGKTLSTLLWLLVFALMVSLTGFIALMGFIHFAVEGFTIWSGVTAIVCSFLIYLTFKLPSLLVEFLDDLIIDKHIHLQSDLGWPSDTKASLLNYQVSFDEARIAVSTFSIVSEIPRRIWDWWAKIATSYWLYILLFSFFFMGLGEFFELPDDHWIAIFALPSVLLLFTPFILLPLAFLALISPLLRSHPAGFGWEGLTQHFVYDVKITSNPAPHWTGRLENETMNLDAKFGRIRHSAFYDDDSVINDVITRLQPEN